MGDVDDEPEAGFSGGAAPESEGIATPTTASFITTTSTTITVAPTIPPRTPACQFVWWRPAWCVVSVVVDMRQAARPAASYRRQGCTHGTTAA